MTLPALIITGTELILARAGEVVAREPNVAHVARREILFGRRAEARARLAPQQFEDRYWTELADAPLATAHRRVATSADLAYLQLEQFLSRVALDDPLILAVHSGYSREQLALLLGMFQHLPAEVVGLVNTAVAALSTYPSGRYRYFEPARHGLMVSDVDVAVDGRDAVLVDAFNRTEAGLSRYFEASAEAVAQVFLRSVRFDPLSSLESEQALFDALPRWLSALAQGASPDAVITHGGREYVVTLHPDFLDAQAFVLPALLANQHDNGRRPMLTENCAGLPGVAASLPGAGVVTVDGLLRRIEQHLGHIRHDPPALPWITRIPHVDDLLSPGQSEDAQLDREPAAPDASRVQLNNARAAVGGPQATAAQDNVEEGATAAAAAGDALAAMVGGERPLVPEPALSPASAAELHAGVEFRQAPARVQAELPLGIVPQGDAGGDDSTPVAQESARGRDPETLRPTHILIGAQAFLLRESGTVEVSSSGSLSAAGEAAGVRLVLSAGRVTAIPLIDSVWLNGRRLNAAQQVYAGAVLEVGTHPCRLFVLNDVSPLAPV